MENFKVEGDGKGTTKKKNSCTCCYLRLSLKYAAAVWHGQLHETELQDLEGLQKSVACSLLKATWVRLPRNSYIQALYGLAIPAVAERTSEFFFFTNF